MIFYSPYRVSIKFTNSVNEIAFHKFFISKLREIICGKSLEKCQYNEFCDDYLKKIQRESRLLTRRKR